MKLVFAGTPEFARQAYVALHDAGFDIPLVLTQPDRPAGRGLKLQASPVKQQALAFNASLLQVRSLRLDGKYPDEAQLAHDELVQLQPDLMIVAAYGLILPRSVLAIPRYGCLNIHASLLPRWRGAAPIQRAILAGDTETGVCIMQMDEGLDTGDVLLTETVPITDKTNAMTLHDELAQTGAKLIVEAVKHYQQLRPVPQASDGITYAEKITKAEALIDWGRPLIEIDRAIRAYNPVPGASVLLPFDDQPIKVWQAALTPYSSTEAPGTVLTVSAQGIDVVTGDQGVVRLLELQRAGAKRQLVDVFVRGLQSDRYA